MQRKYLIRISILFLFLAGAATFVRADDRPPAGIEQKFAVGLNVLASGGTAVGVNARYWSESNFGFEAGYAHATSQHIIPFSLLYTITHINQPDFYVRPYLGGGINISRISVGTTGSRYLDDYLNNYLDEIGFDKTKVGGQGFVGAELTFKKVPQLSFGLDVGYWRIHGDGDAVAGIHVNYYLK